MFPFYNVERASYFPGPGIYFFKILFFMGPPKDISYSYGSCYFASRAKAGPSLFVIKLSLYGVSSRFGCVSTATNAHILLAISEGSSPSGFGGGNFVEWIASRWEWNVPWLGIVESVGFGEGEFLFGGWVIENMIRLIEAEATFGCALVHVTIIILIFF